MVKIFNKKIKPPQSTPTDTGAPPTTGPITTPQVEGPGMSVAERSALGALAPATDFSSPKKAPSLPPASTPPTGYDPKDLAKAVNAGKTPEDSGLYKPSEFSPKQMSKAIATGTPPPTDANGQPLASGNQAKAFSPYTYDPSDLASVYDSVYGKKPGFIATDAPDGGFLEWARKTVNPEQVERTRKANNARLGILALADAIRQFGNIYHTTKGAPSQTFNKPVEEEYQRQEADSERSIRRLQAQYESEMKRLDAAYKRALEHQKLDEARELREERMQLQKDNLELKRQMAENQQEDREWKRDFYERQQDERERSNRVREGQSQQRVNYYISGGSRGGGGRGRAGSTGNYRRYGGGGSGSTSKLFVPKEVTTSSGVTKKLDTPGKMDHYVGVIYKWLADKGLVEKRKNSRASQLKEIEAHLDNPIVREYAEQAGFLPKSKGGSGGGGEAEPRPAEKGGGRYNIATDGTGGGSVSVLGGGVGNIIASNAGKQTTKKAPAAPAPKTPAKPAPKTPAKNQGKSNAGQQSGRAQQSAVLSASGIYNPPAASKGLIIPDGKGGGSKGGAPTRPAARSGSAPSEYSSNRAGTSSKGGINRTVTAFNKQGRRGTLVVPTEIYDVRSKKWRFSKTSDTLRNIYNAFVKHGWVPSDARTEEEMVDAIYDNLDLEGVKATLDTLGIGYDDEPGFVDFLVD